ncbi:MAG: hypothetical protein RLZ14_1955, partial [Actinomycetota bacterium]|jgi:hypothetical protein
VEARQSGLVAELEATGVSTFDLLRSLTGRRSAAQMVAMGLPADTIVAALAGSPLKPPA